MRIYDTLKKKREAMYVPQAPGPRFIIIKGDRCENCLHIDQDNEVRNICKKHSRCVRKRAICKYYKRIDLKDDKKTN